MAVRSLAFKLTSLVLWLSFFLQFIVIFVKCEGLYLADILWDTQNPLFNKSLCEPLMLFAKYGDRVTFVCGHPNIYPRANPSSSIRRPEEFYHNIYYTNDVEIFKARDGSKSTLVYNCKAEGNGANFERYLVYTYSFVVNPFRMGNMPGFNEGTSHFFFSTSDGTKGSLNNKIGDGSNQMGIRINICNTFDYCPQRFQPHVCMEPRKYYTRSNNDAQKQKTSSDEGNTSLNKPEFYLSVIAAFVIGSLFGILLGIKRLQCHREVYGERQSKLPRQVSTNSRVAILQSQEVSPEEVRNSHEV